MECSYIALFYNKRQTFYSWPNTHLHTQTNGDGAAFPKPINRPGAGVLGPFDM